jgi:hypothetical protein
MTLKDKIKNLFNVKKWASQFVIKLILNKGVKHAVTVIIGLITGAKVQTLLTQYGVDLDVPSFQAELTVLFGGLAGSFINWAQKVIDPDDDGELGTKTVAKITTEDKSIT